VFSSRSYPSILEFHSRRLNLSLIVNPTLIQSKMTFYNWWPVKSLTWTTLPTKSFRLLNPPRNLKISWSSKSPWFRCSHSPSINQYGPKVSCMTSSTSMNTKTPLDCSTPVNLTLLIKQQLPNPMKSHRDTDQRSTSYLVKIKSSRKWQKLSAKTYLGLTCKIMSSFYMTLRTIK